MNRDQWRGSWLLLSSFEVLRLILKAANSTKDHSHPSSLHHQAEDTKMHKHAPSDSSTTSSPLLSDSRTAATVEFPDLPIYPVAAIALFLLPGIRNN